MRIEDDIKEKEGHGKEISQGPEVMIRVNSTTFKIHRGHRTVSEIKTVAGVPLADDLDQVVCGKLIPLADDGALVIKGGEEFISHPKDGASS
jgi:hypothetical protein